MTSPDINGGGSVCPDHNILTPSSTYVAVTQVDVEADETVVVSEERVPVFDYFSCEEAIKRLNEYLDSELDQAEREDVIRHLKVCGPCLERFHFEKGLIVALRNKVRLTMAPLKLKERLSFLMKNN